MINESQKKWSQRPSHLSGKHTWATYTGVPTSQSRTEPDLLEIQMRARLESCVLRRLDFHSSHVAQITSFCFSFTSLCEISGNHIWLLLTLWRLWVISQSPEFWMWKWCVIYSWRVKRITRSDNGEGIPSVVLLWTNSNRQNIHLRKPWRHSVFGLEGKPDPWRSSEEWGTLKNVFLAGSLQIRCPGRQSLSL